MELFSLFKVEDVKRLFRQYDKNVTPYYFVEVKCMKCGKIFSVKKSKTALVEAIRVIKHDREGKKPKSGIIGHKCDECSEKESEERKIQAENMRKNEKEYREECTDRYIKDYLNPSSYWKHNVKNWTKIQSLQNAYVDWSEISEYIKEMSYSDFLKTPYWKAISERIRYRAKNKCQMCGSDKNLNVHHRSYENHGDEIHHMEDLICICGNCHSKFHNKKSYEKR